MLGPAVAWLGSVDPTESSLALPPLRYCSEASRGRWNSTCPTFQVPPCPRRATASASGRGPTGSIRPHLEQSTAQASRSWCLDAAPSGEIGRAAYRERGCMYVVI